MPTTASASPKPAAASNAASTSYAALPPTIGPRATIPRERSQADGGWSPSAHPDAPDLNTLDTLKVGRAAGALKTDAFDEYRAALEALTALASHQQELRDHALLRDLLRSYGDRYARLKRDRSGLDFDDLELLVDRLLRDDPVVRERWSSRFQHVMIDEFQDTNPLQNELLGRIAGDRLFRVGDEFQSIYRFRHADVSVFRDQAEQARGDGCFEALTTNFRSRPEVLDAIDLLFGSVWGERFPACAPATAATGRPTGPASSWWSPTASTPGALAREARGRGAARRSAGRRRLRRLPARRRPRPRRRGADARQAGRRAGRRRAAGVGDIVLLVRATTHLAAYERALEDRGVPTYVMGGRGYWSQQQVGDLRAYLAALANPLDDLALYTALVSPLGGLSLDALVVLKTTAQRHRVEPWTLLSGLARDGSPSSDSQAERASIPRQADLAAELSTEDAQRARAFARLLAEERASAPRSSLEALIDRGVTRSGYDLHLLALPSGKRRMANVRKLMRLAREFEAEEGRDLRRFIDYVAERDELGDRQGEAPLEPEDVQAVRLMTVHRAKGLEFPVVCVADLGKPGREDRSALQISDDGAVGISLAQLGGGSVASTRLKDIRERQKLADEEEEKRVFYVAATRAEQHLILSGGTDLEKLDEEKPLEEPMRWIWRALAPGIGGIETSAVVEHELDGRGVEVRCTVLRPDTVDELLPAADRAPVPPEQPPAGLDALDAPALAAVPPPQALPISRLSYSGLQRHRECGYRFYLERSLRLPRAEAIPELPPETAPEEIDALSPTVRGSIAHSLLEGIDFANPVIPTTDQVATMIDAYREPVRAPEVDDLIALVTSFANSQLRARIAAADPVRTELPFAFSLSPDTAAGRSLLVNGIVDVHAIEPDGTVLIVDYKSHRLGDEDPAAIVESDYGIQRTVYALAALRSGAPQTEIAYLFLERPDDPITTTYDRTDLQALDRRLRDLAAPIAAGSFIPTPNPHRALCADCPGQPGLCSWPPEKTLTVGPPGWPTPAHPN